MSDETTPRQHEGTQALDEECRELRTDSPADTPTDRQTDRQASHADSGQAGDKKRGLRPVAAKIGEGGKNLAQRGEWFQQRTGGG